MKLRLLPAAIVDLKQAKQWYESEQSGLGDKFAQEAEDVFNKIEASPFSYQKISGELRRAIMYRFHYAVIYRARAEEIIVIRLIHCASKTHQDILLR